MFESIMRFFKKMSKKENKPTNSKEAAKERLHLVLMQDRANVSADFLELMKQEIIEVIKKYIDIDEKAIDVRLTNKENEDGTNGAPALYANIPIINIKNETRKINVEENKQEQKQKQEQVKEESKENPKIEEKKEEKEKEIKEKNNKENNINEAGKNKEESKEKLSNQEEKPKESKERKENSKEEIKSENKKKSD